MPSSMRSRDVREVQPHRVVAAAVGVERLAGHERDVLFERLGEQLAGVDRRRHLGPDEQAALRSGPGAAFGKCSSIARTITSRRSR